MDSLLPSLIKRQLDSKRLGKPIHHYVRLGSTNDIADQLASAGAPEGTMVVTEHQTHGRGRLGRSWFSQKGKDLCFSLVLRPDVPPCNLSCLSLILGIAVGDAIEKISGLKPDLKWPNDLLINGKKCCGILSEVRTELGEVKYLIVGIGINVNAKVVSTGLSMTASTLFQQTGRQISRSQLLVEILNCFEPFYFEFLDQKIKPLLDLWVKKSSYAEDRWVLVKQIDRSFQGITQGLSKHGALLVKRGEGWVEEVLAGDIIEWDKKVSSS